jgi:hypothetical protein
MKTAILLVTLGLLAVGFAALPAATATCTPTPVEQVCVSGSPGNNLCVRLDGAVISRCLPP